MHACVTSDLVIFFHFALKLGCLNVIHPPYLCAYIICLLLQYVPTLYAYCCFIFPFPLNCKINNGLLVVNSLEESVVTLTRIQNRAPVGK